MNYRKVLYIRILRKVLGLKDPDMYRMMGPRWTHWEIGHLHKLDAHVNEIARSISVMAGEDDCGTIDYLQEMMTRIYEAHGNVTDPLVDLLKRGSKPGVEIKRVLGGEGHTTRDVDKAAREIGVLKEKRKGPRGSITIYWRLPNGQTSLLKPQHTRKLKRRCLPWV